MSTSTIVVILVSAVILIIALKILTGLLRLGVTIAIIGFVGYWLYTNVFSTYIVPHIK